MTQAVVAFRGGPVAEAARLFGADPYAAFESMASALDLLPFAVLLVEASGNVVFGSRRARRYLALGCGIRESHGRLRCEFSEDSSRLVKALRRTALGQAPFTPVVVTARRGDGGPRFELLLVPAPSRQGVLIFASTPEKPAGFSEALARELYGLSERESQVASSIVKGHTLEETAEVLGVEKETVRSHLKRIFAKTQTSRQAELARLLSVGLFGLETEP